MSEAWSAQQHEWLQAMGLQVFALADAGPASIEPGDPPAATASRAGSVPSPSRREAGAAPPLLRALLKAARRGAGDPEFTRAVPDVEALRGNAAAKRAAWPRLRALRRASRP